MYSDMIFAKTAKGEREKANLPDNLKRMLSLINGNSVAAELVKRAPPSLRQDWDELLGELLRDGYIAEAIEAVPTRVVTTLELAPTWTTQSGAGQIRTPKASPLPVTAADLKEEKTAKLKGFFAAAKEKAAAEAKQAALEMAQARAALEVVAAKRSAGAGAGAKAGQHEDEAASARASLEAAIAAAKARSDAEAAAQAEAKARVEARQQDVIAARVRAEHQAVMAASQARAVADAKLRAEKAACAHAEREAAVATVQARAAELAQAQAEALRREKDSARTRAELEAAISAAKRRTEARPISAGKTTQNAEAEIPVAFAVRLRDLAIENDTLKSLLSEAYQEIALLKNRIRD
jgi:hypothetical protein